MPDTVRDLVVYRVNQTAVWLRWQPPGRPSGKLVAYVVDLQPEQVGESSIPFDGGACNKGGST